MRISSSWRAAEISLLALVACGDPDQLTGDVRFPIEGGHLIRIDAGNGTPPIAEIYLTEPDVDCATLQAFDASGATGSPLPRPFRQAVALEFFDVGNSGYEIGNSQSTFSVVNSEAEWLVGESGGAIAVAGAIGVKGDQPKHIDGTFDTTALEASDFARFVTQGGFVDGAGTPRWADGGAIQALKLSGSFSVDVCP